MDGKPAGGAGTAGKCDGLKNQTGITDKSITIANASDISGPMPGLFQSSQDATKAYVAYFNATTDICGRKLELATFDSRTDAGADQQAYASACEKTFAAVGSMSAFDSGGAGTAATCGLPDIRAASVTPERNGCRTCFGAQSVQPNLVQNSVPDYFVKSNRAAAQKAAFLYLNIGAVVPNSKSQVKAWEARGFDVIYHQGVDVSEFNYAPYVQQMMSKGVRYVQFMGGLQQAVRLAQAMQQQGFKPDAYVLDPTAYDADYVESTGAAGEGTRIYINTSLFEEASSNPEMRLYQQWLQQVRPGARPTYFGLFSWSAARLFVEQAVALGGALTRASLVERMRRVDNWTGNGVHGPQHVGAKRTGDCWAIIRLQQGRWVRESGKSYMCRGVTDTGVGG